MGSAPEVTGGWKRSTRSSEEGGRAATGLSRVKSKIGQVSCAGRFKVDLVNLWSNIKVFQSLPLN